MIVDPKIQKALELGRRYVQERLDCTELLDKTFGGKESEFDKMQRENMEQMLADLAIMDEALGYTATLNRLSR